MHHCTTAVMIFAGTFAETEKYPTDAVRGVHLIPRSRPTEADRQTASRVQ